ncbi:MAG: DNA polymerase III subunit delta [Buchnera aphidicola (Meitanaphis elongallis)]
MSRQTLTKATQKQLSYLSTFINPNLLLIIYKKTQEKTEQTIWLNIFKLHGTIVYCYTLNTKTLNVWVKNRINYLKINIHEHAKNLLLQFYEKNTLSLYNILNILTLIWPKNLITVKKIQKIISDKAIFTPENWIDAMFSGNFNKTQRILNTFCINNYNQIALMRCLQHNLITILMIQRKKSNNINYIFEKQKVHKNRTSLLVSFSNRISFEKIYKSIKLLKKIEINIKKRHEKSMWNQLKILPYIIN